MASFRSQIKLHPRSDWSPLGVEFKIFSQHTLSYHMWASPPLPRGYDCLPPTHVVDSILELCHVLFALFMICDMTFLWVFGVSSLLINQRNNSKFEFGPQENDVIQSNLVIVFFVKRRYMPAAHKTLRCEVNLHRLSRVLLFFGCISDANGGLTFQQISFASLNQFYLLFAVNTSLSLWC